MTPISRTSERPTDIVHVQDQAKICLYLGQELIMANSVLDLLQPIIEIKYLYIQKMFPLSKALEISLNIICLPPKSESDVKIKH